VSPQWGTRRIWHILSITEYFLASIIRYIHEQKFSTERLVLQQGERGGWSNRSRGMSLLAPLTLTTVPSQGLI